MNNTFDNNFKKGCFAALGIPGISLAASFFALGALFKNSGLNAIQSFLSTLIGFALPGQVVMAETLIVNGTLLNILIAVFLTNARLYPMTVNLVPVIRQKSAGILSAKVFVALIFLNPIYFMCMIVSVLNKSHIVATVFLSVILAPILFLVTPDWSVLLAGTISGIISYFIFIR